MTKIYPQIRLDGFIHYQEIDNKQFEIRQSIAYIDVHNLLFEFKECNLCIDLRSLTLCEYNFEKKIYRDNYNGHQCKLYGWLGQKAIFSGNEIIFISGIIEILDGLASGSYKLNGFFPSRRTIPVLVKDINRYPNDL